MNVLIAGVAAALLLVPHAQSASPLGDDPATFDRLFDSAYLRHDVAFVEAAIADGVRVKLGPRPDDAAWNRQQLIDAVRDSDALVRQVDSVLVDAHSDVVKTRGHILVKGTTADGPETHIYYARMYRRSARGWVLASHETIAQVNHALSLPRSIFREGEEGVTPPRLLSDAKPQYTSDAMRAKINGAVSLNVIVGADGRVGDVLVVKSLDRVNGLDDQCVKAASQWRFAPGIRNGEPVPFLVWIDMTFTLR